MYRVPIEIQHIGSIALNFRLIPKDQIWALVEQDFIINDNLNKTIKLPHFIAEDILKEAEYNLYKINIGYVLIPDFRILQKYIIHVKLFENLRTNLFVWC